MATTMLYELYRQLSNGHLEWICVESSDAKAQQAAADISLREGTPIVALRCSSNGSTTPAWRIYRGDISAIEAWSDMPSRDISAATASAADFALRAQIGPVEAVSR